MNSEDIIRQISNEKQQYSYEIHLLHAMKTVSTMEKNKSILKFHLHWETDANSLDIQHFHLLLIHADQLTACEVLELYIVWPLFI